MSKATREVYGEALVEVGGNNNNIVVLDADLANATKTELFKKAYPERFFDMGIAEADMLGTAAGLATSGKIPFVSSFAVFAVGRAYDQIRNSIAYPELNVKICATHAGISVGEDGATHQAIEDISLMRTMPNMTVISPCDEAETRWAIKEATKIQGPVYVRLGRMKVENVYSEDEAFEFGKGKIVRNGDDVTIFATGLMVKEAVIASDLLREKDISVRVVDIHTIKPIDRELIIKCAKETKRIITAEEHSIIGGLGSAVMEVLSEEYPVKVERIGLNDCFGESGNGRELLKKYGLTAEAIVERIG